MSEQMWENISLIILLHLLWTIGTEVIELHLSSGFLFFKKNKTASVMNSACVSKLWILK